MRHHNRTLAEDAETFAEWSHGNAGQLRKYTGEPYIVHPREVAALVRSVPHDEAMVAAAFLHDVVEDTPVSIERIRDIFGDDVASLVDQLTDVSKPSDGNRKARKEIDRQHTAKASARAKTIKLADLISNTESITAHDHEFAKVYLREKRALLEVLKEGDAVLYLIAAAKCGANV